MWETLKSRAVFAYEVLRAAGEEYGKDRVTRMAAAVSYRAIFALAPLLLLAVAIFGLVLGSSETAETEILDAVMRVGGQQVHDAVERVLGSIESTSGTAALVGFGLLLWTASSLFIELQNDLNDIFGVPYEHTSGVLPFIRKRGLGFLAAISLGLVLIAVWLLNGIWQFLGGIFPDSFEPVHRLIGYLTPLASLIVLPFVMALTFQVLCRVKIQWRAIWWGSVYTSIAFLAAAYGTGAYFNLSGTSAAGIAGSAVVILLLAFVLSSVYLFGAEVMKIHHNYLVTGSLDSESEGAATEAVFDTPEPSAPLSAVLGFLAGLFVGWRRRR